jgi:uncharacterized protein YggU (UPF0235/DUF167 family)
VSGSAPRSAGGFDGVVEASGADVIVHVHVVPRCGVRGLAGRHGGALRIRVQEPPVDGRATEAARRVLAEVLGVAAGRVTLRSGERSRSKRFRVADFDLETARGRVAAALAE